MSADMSGAGQGQPAFPLPAGMSSAERQAVALERQAKAAELQAAELRRIAVALEQINLHGVKVDRS